MRVMGLPNLVVFALAMLLVGSIPKRAYADIPISADIISAEFLAGKIAESSGCQPAQYERYSKKLALTLSLLSSEQHSRILGTSAASVLANATPNSDIKSNSYAYANCRLGPPHAGQEIVALNPVDGSHIREGNLPWNRASPISPLALHPSLHPDSPANPYRGGKA